MAFEWVEDSLLGHLVGLAPEINGITAWKNLNFDPSGRILWLKVINVPVTETVATLGDYGDNEQRGFLQIGVYQKAGTGTLNSSNMIGIINNVFKIPQRLEAPASCMLRLETKNQSHGGQTSQADLSAGGAEGLWDARYITINWLAREPR